MTIILLEGADGAGKSTLAAQLATYHGGAVIEHFGPPDDPECAESVWTDAIERARFRIAPTIFDRLHWGEIAYGNVYRGGSAMGWDGFHRINERLDRARAITVYVRITAETAAKRIGERGDDYVKPKDMGAIVNWYDEMMRVCKSELFVIDNNVAFNASYFSWALYQIAEARKRVR